MVYLIISCDAVVYVITLFFLFNAFVVYFCCIFGHSVIRPLFCQGPLPLDKTVSQVLDLNLEI